MKYFFIVLTVFVSSSLNAQSAEDSVKTVISKMFTAMKNADTASLVSCFSDSVIFQTIAWNREGKMMVRNEDFSSFADFVGRQKPGVVDERIEFDVVKTDGPLAIAWTPYKFYNAGTFSHCGVNSFQVIRFNGSWKIHYLIDTRRRTGCKE